MEPKIIHVDDNDFVMMDCSTGDEVSELLQYAIKMMNPKKYQTSKEYYRSAQCKLNIEIFKLSQNCGEKIENLKKIINEIKNFSGDMDQLNDKLTELQDELNKQFKNFNKELFLNFDEATKKYYKEKQAGDEKPK